MAPTAAPALLITCCRTVVHGGKGGLDWGWGVVEWSWGSVLSVHRASFTFFLLKLCKTLLFHFETASLHSQVEEGLAQGDCKRALAWCGENRSMLTRLQSPLEGKLRVQQFLQLAQADRLKEALSLAQKCFTANNAADPLLQVRQATLAGSLSFPSLVCFVFGAIPIIPSLLPSPPSSFLLLSFLGSVSREHGSREAE